MANRLLVISSLLMAVATFCLAIASFYQYRTFQSQLATMREQAAAAKKSVDISLDQAQAVRDSAKAAKDSAAAANMLTEQNKELIGAAKTQANASMSQANTSDVTAKSAQRSAEIAREAMIVTSRPYVVAFAEPFGRLEANQVAELSVRFVNDGNSPAEVTTMMQFVFSDSPAFTPTALVKADANEFSMIRYFQPTVVAPHREVSETVTSGLSLTTKDFEAIRKFEKWLIFYGQGSYKGVGGPYPINICRMYHYDSSTDREHWSDYY